MCSPLAPVNVFAAIQDIFPEAVYHAQGRTIVMQSGSVPVQKVWCWS